MQSARKDGPQLIDDFVNTAYEYYKVHSAMHLVAPVLRASSIILNQL